MIPETLGKQKGTWKAKGHLESKIRGTSSFNLQHGAQQ